MRLLIALAMLGGLTARPAAAGTLLYDRCRGGRTARVFDGAEVVFASVGGMSCEQIRNTIAAGTTIAMALMPAQKIITMTSAGEQIAADLAAMGLSMGNPAVLGVTVLGAIGVSVVYFVVRQSLEDCERADRAQLRQDLLRELRHSGIDASKAELKIQR